MLRWNRKACTSFARLGWGRGHRLMESGNTPRRGQHVQEVRERGEGEVTIIISGGWRYVYIGVLRGA